MDSRFALGCAISMNLVQFQSKLLMPKIFQEFGIETAGAVIVDRALIVQSLSCSYYGEIASRLMLVIFQCRSCRILLIQCLCRRIHHKKFREHSIFVEDIIINSKTAWLCSSEAFN
jgi:capsular polysaccharide biosynthesis protein